MVSVPVGPAARVGARGFRALWGLGAREAGNVARAPATRTFGRYAAAGGGVAVLGVGAKVGLQNVGKGVGSFGASVGQGAGGFFQGASEGGAKAALNLAPLVALGVGVVVVVMLARGKKR